MPLPEDWKMQDVELVTHQTAQQAANAAAKKAAVAALEWAASTCKEMARKWGGDAGAWESVPASDCEDEIRAKLAEINECG